EIREQRPRGIVVNLGSGRDAQAQVLAAATVHVLVRAVLAVGRVIFGLVAVVEQSRKPLVHYQDDAAAIAAVTARRTALGHELLAPKRDRAIAPVPRAHVDAGLVYEHGDPERVPKPPRDGTRRAKPAAPHAVIHADC